MRRRNTVTRGFTGAIPRGASPAAGASLWVSSQRGADRDGVVEGSGEWAAGIARGGVLCGVDPDGLHPEDGQRPRLRPGAPEPLAGRRAATTGGADLAGGGALP